MSVRVKIEDVARLAGVTKGTVSTVLNGRATEFRISAETVQRVREAADQLDYQPSALGRMLARKRTESIGLVLQYARYFSSSSSFMNEVMAAVCEACTEHSHDLLLHTSTLPDPKTEAAALCDGRVDGILALRDGSDPVINEVNRRGLPMVLFFSRSEIPGVCYVDSDNFAGARTAVNYLIENGHRRIAMVTGPQRSTAAADRCFGYRSALEAAGLPCRPEYEVSFSELSIESEALRSLLQGPEAPTAFFSWSDDDALTLMPILRDFGLQVPTDISIVGFDSTSAADRCFPTLTSVRQPIGEIARTAASLLLEIVQGREIERTGTVFPLSLDIRSSVRRLSPSHEHATKR